MPPFEAPCRHAARSLASSISASVSAASRTDEFAVALPDDWNGRFVFRAAAGLTVRCFRRWASTRQDTSLRSAWLILARQRGHKGEVFDFSFFADQDAALNFLYRANDKVTQVAKAIIAAHYGRRPAHSCWLGCSTGGREGMMMSQRFPDYFDGIVAGAPAMRTGESNTGDRYIFAQLNAIAPRDEKERYAACAVGGDRAQTKSLLAACDGARRRGWTGVFDVEHCGFDRQRWPARREDRRVPHARTGAGDQGGFGAEDFTRRAGPLAVLVRHRHRVNAGRPACSGPTSSFPRETHEHGRRSRAAPLQRRSPRSRHGFVDNPASSQAR
jgi:hypothetical protein